MSLLRRKFLHALLGLPIMAVLPLLVHTETLAIATAINKAAPQNTQENKNELLLAGQSMAFLANALDHYSPGKPNPNHLQYVAASSENVLQVMDTVINLYQSILSGTCQDMKAGVFIALKHHLAQHNAEYQHDQENDDRNEEQYFSYPLGTGCHIRKAKKTCNQ